MSCVWFQTSMSVYEHLRQGKFGKCDQQAEDYKLECHKHFPIAILFKPPVVNNIDATTTDLDSAATAISNGASS